MSGRYRALGTWLCGLAIAALGVAACGGGGTTGSTQQSAQPAKLVYFNARMAERPCRGRATRTRSPT